MSSLLDTSLTEGQLTWEFQGGGGRQNQTFVKKHMELNWNFQGGRGAVQTKKPSMGPHTCPDDVF